MKKYAIVTGTSSGLGEGALETLLSLDYVVFGGSRRKSLIDHQNFIDIELDIMSKESVEDFFNTISEYTDRIDIFVNNASYAEFASFSNLSYDEFLSQYQTNTAGTFYLYKCAENFLIAGRSHFVNTLSLAAKKSYPNLSAFCSAEQGKLGFLKSLELEWKKYEVRFSNIFIGAVDTPFWDDILNFRPDSKMLTVNDFLYLFRFLIESPSHMQFSDVTLYHKENYLEL